MAAEGDLKRVRSLRRRVRSVFEAETESEAVEILNDLLADSVAQLRPGKDGWRFSYEPRRARDLADRLAPRVAAALLVAVQTDGWERFGVCDALPCRCVYLDRSRNRSRRYCCQLCADRVAAAHYRDRVLRGVAREQQREPEVGGEAEHRQRRVAQPARPVRDRPEDREREQALAAEALHRPESSSSPMTAVANAAQGR